MDSTRDDKGKFLKGNIAARKRAGLARTGEFLSIRERKRIERELEVMEKELGDQVAGEAGPRGQEKILIGQVVACERTLRYAGEYIKRFGIEDLSVAELQLKSMDTQRHALSDLKIAGGERKFMTPMEKARKFDEGKAEAELEEGEKGVL